MPDVTLNIGGRSQVVGCREGEETRLAALGEMLQARWPTAQKAAGGANNERAMLFVALMLADDLDDAFTRPPAQGGATEPALAKIAERLEALADALEHSAPGA